MVKICTDPGTLSGIGNHPALLKHITDDFNFEFEPRPGSLYLTYEDKGIVSFDPINCICYSVHIALLPELWGRGTEIGKEAVDWVFQNTACQKLVAMVPEYNRLAIRVARSFGRHEGTIRDAFSKGWKLHDLIIFGLSKEVWVWQ